jgi:hypothetical protein
MTNPAKPTPHRSSDKVYCVDFRTPSIPTYPNRWCFTSKSRSNRSTAPDKSSYGSWTSSMACLPASQIPICIRLLGFLEQWRCLTANQRISLIRFFQLCAPLYQRPAKWREFYGLLHAASFFTYCFPAACHIFFSQIQISIYKLPCSKRSS